MPLTNPKHTRSMMTKLRPSHQLKHLAHIAINGAREGGVCEPFLKDSAWESEGLSLLGTGGVVLSHRDAEELPKYSYLWVVYNGGYTIRSPFEEASLMPEQYTGTIVRFNIHKLHTLSADPRRDVCDEWEDGPDGFAGIVFNHGRMFHLRTAERIMRNRLQRLGASLGFDLTEESE